MVGFGINTNIGLAVNGVRNSIQTNVNLNAPAIASPVIASPTAGGNLFGGGPAGAVGFGIGLAATLATGGLASGAGYGNQITGGVGIPGRPCPPPGIGLNPCAPRYGGPGMTGGVGLSGLDQQEFLLNRTAMGNAAIAGAVGGLPAAAQAFAGTYRQFGSEQLVNQSLPLLEQQLAPLVQSGQITPEQAQEIIAQSANELYNAGGELGVNALSAGGIGGFSDAFASLSGGGGAGGFDPTGGGAGGFDPTGGGGGGGFDPSFGFNPYGNQGANFLG